MGANKPLLSPPIASTTLHWCRAKKFSTGGLFGIGEIIKGNSKDASIHHISSSPLVFIIQISLIELYKHWVGGYFSIDFSWSFTWLSCNISKYNRGKEITIVNNGGKRQLSSSIN
ncbi:hypothetical protein ACTA71_011273 [Dictyostelium dimigraforme]